MTREDILPLVEFDAHHFSLLFDGVFDICYLLDDELRFVRLNRSASRATRMNLDDLLGQPFAHIFAEANGSIHLATYQKVIETKTPQNFTTDVLLPEGITGNYEVSVYPLEKGLLCIANDISARRHAEHQAHEQRVLAEALGDIAATINSTLQLDEVLDRILRSIESVVPHDMANIMLLNKDVAYIVRHRGYDENGFDEYAKNLTLRIDELPHIKEMIETGDPLVIPDVYQIPSWKQLDQRDFLRSLVSAPIVVQGDTIGLINLDSTRLLAFTTEHGRRLKAFADQAGIALRNAQLYEDLRTTAETLRERNSALDTFSQTVAHDLKSPLQIIIGFSNMIIGDFASRLDEETMSYIGYIEKYALRMNRIVSDLLLLAQASSVEPQITPFDPMIAIQSALIRLKPRLEESLAQVGIEEPFPLIDAHPAWLEEVFVNLIENALKYSDPTKDELAISIRSAPSSNDMVRLEVEDNGIGIDAEDIPRLFQSFSRLEKIEAEGTGLGLSITETIIRHMGGKVGVQSIPGVGSTFWFTLRAANQPDQHSKR